MTLVVALVWGRGVLVSADSRASTGIVFHEERKIEPIYFGSGDDELDLAIAGGAGDAALVKSGFDVIKEVFSSWIENVERRNPDDSELRSIVRTIEDRLMRKYAELRRFRINPDVQLLLASVTNDGKPRLYVFDDRGLAQPMHDNPGYVLLGRGAVTGGLMLLRLLDYRPGEAWEWDLGLLSAFIIDAVSEVDPSVSPFLGESYFIRYDAEKEKVVLGPLTEEAYREYKAKLKKRRALFKLLWGVAEEIEEDEIEDILRQIKESKSQRQNSN